MTYRENVKAVLESNFAGFKDEIIETATNVIISLEQPKVKTGHWMKKVLGYKCSNCTLCTNEKGRLTYNYCPNCGAKMVEPQESEG